VSNFRRLGNREGRRGEAQNPGQKLGKERKRSRGLPPKRSEGKLKGKGLTSDTWLTNSLDYYQTGENLRLIEQETLGDNKRKENKKGDKKQKGGNSLLER